MTSQEEAEALRIAMLRIQEGRCIRCGASEPSDSGCTSHDWPWDHGLSEKPEGFDS